MTAPSAAAAAAAATTLSNSTGTSNLLTNVCYCEGRPPWYDEQGHVKAPIIIGVVGPTSSGKEELCTEICRQLQNQWVSVISLTSFYKDLTDAQREHPDAVNFDVPNAFDFEELRQVLEAIKSRKRADIPAWDFKTHQRSGHQKMVYGVDVVLVEGILAFYDPEVRKMMDIKLFIESDADVRLARRLKRDVAQRGRTVEQCLRQYSDTVKPGCERFCMPLKKFADVIVPSTTSFTNSHVISPVAVDLIVKQIQKVMGDRGWTPVLPPLDTDKLPANVHQVEQTHRVKQMQTILRDATTSHDDFVFYNDRLNSLLIEAALTLLPYKPCTVQTPTGCDYAGEEFMKKLCGVSIMRSGSTMEEPLRRICKGIRMGKILIQSDESRAPFLLYVKLPPCIAGRHVLLLDPMLVSGATATMAVHVLLDHGVKPKDISLITGVASLQGIHEVMRKFPELTLVTGSIEKIDLREKGYLIAGQGFLPERYFGF